MDKNTDRYSRKENTKGSLKKLLILMSNVSCWIVRRLNWINNEVFWIRKISLFKRKSRDCKSNLTLVYNKIQNFN